MFQKLSTSKKLSTIFFALGSMISMNTVGAPLRSKVSSHPEDGRHLFDTGVNILAKIPFFFYPTFSLFLPRFLVLNNRKLYFFLVFGYLLISSNPPPPALLVKIFTLESINQSFFAPSREN